MKRLARSIVRLYPATWRNRYGHELNALLDDTAPSWTHIPDIMQQALRMRLALANWPLIVAFATAGLTVSTVIAVRTTYRYVSTAEFVIQTPGAAIPERRVDFGPVFAEIASRKSLTPLITSPALDLYRDEREHEPFQDVIAKMRKDLTVDVTYPRQAEVRARISYAGATPSQAQSTTRAIATRILGDYAAKPSRRALILPAVPAPTLPTAPDGLRAWMIVALGLAAGLLASGIFTVIRWAPGKAALVAAVTALVGVAWLAAPPNHTQRGVLRADSRETLNTIVEKLPLWLAGIQKPGYTISLEPDSTGAGAQLMATGPDRVKAGSQILDIVLKASRQATAGRWVDWELENQPPPPCYWPERCKIASFDIGAYEFEGIEPTVPNGIFAASSVIGLTAAVCALWNRRRRSGGIAAQPKAATEPIS